MPRAGPVRKPLVPAHAATLAPMLIALLLVLALVFRQPHSLLAMTEPAGGALGQADQEQQQHHHLQAPERVFRAVNAGQAEAASGVGQAETAAGEQRPGEAGASAVVADPDAEAATHAALTEVLEDLGAVPDSQRRAEQAPQITPQTQSQPKGKGSKRAQRTKQKLPEQTHTQHREQVEQQQPKRQEAQQQEARQEQQQALQLPAGEQRSRLLQTHEQRQQHQQPHPQAQGGGGGGEAAVPQLTVLMLSTFKDIARALTSLSTVRTHLAPELVGEGILLTPWQEFLALRHAVNPIFGGRPCPQACYTRNTPDGKGGSGSKVVRALRDAGLLLPSSPFAAAPGAGGSSASPILISSSALESLDCERCGPPLWVVPEHLALGVERHQLSEIKIHGYRLQMVLKLMVSSLISTSHYLVLDSDVLMVRPVGPAQLHWLFPEPGKSVYQPQRRSAHARWWNATEQTLGLSGCLSAHPDTRVFGVTPAILATRLAAAAAGYWDARLGSGSRLRALKAMLPRRRPWFTEYCSYHLVAECQVGAGSILEHHAVPRKGAKKGKGKGGKGGKGAGGEEDAPALYRGLWRNGTWSRPGGRAEPCKDCLYLVVQSNTGVAEGKVVGDLEELFV